MKKNIRQAIKMKLPAFIVIGTIRGTIILLFATNPMQKWTAPPSGDKVTYSVASDIKSLAEGKIIYTKNCYDVHGKKGIGDGSKNAEVHKSAGHFTKMDFCKQSDDAHFWKIAVKKI